MQCNPFCSPRLHFNGIWVAFLGLSLLLPTLADTVIWPDKSGPNRDGTVPEAIAPLVATEWDETSGKNLVWKTALPEEGHSTPVIIGDTLWFTSANPEGTKQYLDAVDQKSGKLIHHHLLFENGNPEPLGNKVNNYAAPSCVADATGLYIHFGTYGTAKIDPTNLKVLWQRRDINCNHFRGPGSSPVLVVNLIVLTFDGVDDQFVTALDKGTGKTVWLTKRSTDYGDLDENGKPVRDGDMRKAYGTPAAVLVGEQWQLISVGSRALFGYEALTGKELWTITHDNYNAAIRPLTKDGLAFIHTGSSRAHWLGVRLDETTLGDVTKSHVVWDRDKRNARFSSPVIVGERLYQVTEGGIVSCLNYRTGDQLWSDRLPGTHIAPILAAGDRFYVFSESGSCVVLKAGDTKEILAENHLEVGLQACPAVGEDGALFLRTKTHLYKIGKQ